MSGPKQDPAEKQRRSLAADGKCYFSYAQIASAVSRCVPEVEAFNPDVFVAIGGFLSVPTYGFLSFMIVPILAVMLVPTVYPAILKTAIRLRLEAQSVLTPPADPNDPVTKAPPSAILKQNPDDRLDQGEADGIDVDNGL